MMCCAVSGQGAGAAAAIAVQARPVVRPHRRGPGAGRTAAAGRAACVSTAGAARWSPHEQQTLRFHHRRRRIRRLALANRLSADPGTSVLVLEAGRTDFIWDPLIHMPAALSMPIGNPRYDWRYASEPEPHMHGRRIAHARGKVLGGSSSINGMIFQRGNPLDYERWAADPGMETLGLRALPAVFQAHGDLPSPAPTPGAAATARCSSSAARRPTRCSRRSSPRPSRRATGAPTTSTATGRKASRRSIATSTAAGATAPRAPTCTRSCDRPEPQGADATRSSPALLFEGTRAVGVECPLRKGVPRTIRAGEVILCGGAINTPQLLQLSGVGPGTPAAAARACRWWPTCPASAPTCRTTSRSTCSTPASSRSRSIRTSRGCASSRVGAQWLFGRTRHRRDQSLRGRRLLPQQRRRRLSQPDVPLPADGHPLRRLGADRRTRLPGARRARCTQTRAARCRSARRTRARRPALRFNYLSTEQDRREWVEAIRVARRILNQPAFAPYNGGEISPGPPVETDEQILDWVKRDAETALHPTCTAKMGTGAGRRGRPGVDARARPAGPAGGRRQRVSVRHQRQHLCADDDGGGERPPT